MTVSSVTPREGSMTICVTGAAHFDFGHVEELGVQNLLFEIGLEPIGLRVALGVGGEIEIGPLRQPAPQFELGLRDAAPAVDGRMAAGQHHLGLPIEGAHQFGLPVVPDAGADRADVADRQDEQHFQPFERLHLMREGEDRLAVAKIAPLRRIGHDEMVFDEPGDGLGLGVAEAKARTERARDRGAGDRMILDAPLGDVVQEQRDDQRGAVVDRQQDFAGQRMFARKALLLDIDEIADRAQQMFVHRVVVIHVELHQRDDLAEFRHEAAEHAGLVHQAQHDLGRIARGQNIEKQAVGFGVCAQFRVDALQRSA